MRLLAALAGIAVLGCSTTAWAYEARQYRGEFPKAEVSGDLHRDLDGDGALEFVCIAVAQGAWEASVIDLETGVVEFSYRCAAQPVILPSRIEYVGATSGTVPLVRITAGEDVVEIAGTLESPRQEDFASSRGPSFGLIPCGPNPSRGEARIGFVLPCRGPASLAVFGVDGRSVATLVDRVLEAGSHEVAWNGRTGDGQSAAAGAYYVQLRVAGNMSTRKIVLWPE